MTTDGSKTPVRVTEDVVVAPRPVASNEPAVADEAGAAGDGRDVPMSTHGLSCYFGSHHVVEEVSLEFPANSVTALIGPSGCGKSTLIRALNRMHEVVPGASTTGEVRLHGADIYERGADPVAVRQAIGMVFQRPNPFPTKSIAENVLSGPRFLRMKLRRGERDDLVERTLRGAGLWNEVKDRLGAPAGGLSGGQQQRLCIARALSTRPDVLLMDEPTGSIDPIATARVEELMLDLVPDHSVVVVTHSMMEARRVANRVAYFHLGQLLEIGPTEQIFEHPQNEKAAAFIQGKFG